MQEGYVHIITGNGKGKTTSALGLTLRAAGAGFQVFILQFIKKGDYSEIKALDRFADQIKVEQFGSGRFIGEKPGPEDIQASRQGLARAKEIISSDHYDLVILDEANVAVKLGLLGVQELIDLILRKPPRLELVITGRYASPQIINLADMVTECRALKHYMSKGVPARRGIEF
jgi:cob(I)alamin adenosyltransferase